MCVLLKKEKTPRTVFNDMCEANANPPSLFFFCEWNSAQKNTIGVVVRARVAITHSPAAKKTFSPQAKIKQARFVRTVFTL